MSDAPLRDELLKQSGYGDGELARLRQAVEIENRRVKRIGRWAAAVWLTWVGMLVASIVVPMVVYQMARQDPSATQPATRPATAVASNAGGGGVMSVLGPIIGALLVGAVFILPVVGIILLVRLLLARRGVHMSQVMASLAAIEAQLRVLTAAKRESGK